jgi:chaperonin GroES
MKKPSGLTGHFFLARPGNCGYLFPTSVEQYPGSFPLRFQGGAPMKSKMKPLGDKVLIRRLEEPELKAGGIIIPDTAKEKPQQGEVIAVGPGRVDKNGKRIPIGVKKGQKVLFGKYSGTEMTVDGEEYLFIDADDIMAILE